MRIINTTRNLNGSYDDSVSDNFEFIPDGWVRVPDNIKLPSTYPFMQIRMENGKIVELIPDQNAYDLAISKTNKMTDINGQEFPILSTQNQELTVAEISTILNILVEN